MKRFFTVIVTIGFAILCTGCQSDPGQDYTQESWVYQHLGSVSYKVPESWGEPEYNSPVDNFESYTYYADTFWVNATFYETGSLTSFYDNAQNYTDSYQEGYKDDGVTRNKAEMLESVIMGDQNAEHFCYKTRYDDPKDLTYTEVYAIDVEVPSYWYGKSGLFVLEFHSSYGDGLKENARKTADQLVESVV